MLVQGNRYPLDVCSAAHDRVIAHQAHNCAFPGGWMSTVLHHRDREDWIRVLWSFIIFKYYLVITKDYNLFLFSQPHYVCLKYLCYPYKQGLESCEWLPHLPPDLSSTFPADISPNHSSRNPPILLDNLSLNHSHNLSWNSHKTSHPTWLNLLPNFLPNISLSL